MIKNIKITRESSITPNGFLSHFSTSFIKIFDKYSFHHKSSLEKKVHTVKSKRDDLAVSIFVADNNRTVSVLFQIFGGIVDHLSERI